MDMDKKDEMYLEQRKTQIPTCLLKPDILLAAQI